MKENLNYSVLKFLQRNGICTLNDISKGIDYSVGQIRAEMARQKDSLADDIIVEYNKNNKKYYYMHSMAKQTPIDLLNHFCAATYEFRSKGPCNGIKMKKKLLKEMKNEMGIGI